MLTNIFMNSLLIPSQSKPHLISRAFGPYLIEVTLRPATAVILHGHFFVPYKTKAALVQMAWSHKHHIAFFISAFRESLNALPGGRRGALRVSSPSPRPLSHLTGNLVVLLGSDRLFPICLGTL